MMQWRVQGLAQWAKAEVAVTVCCAYTKTDRIEYCIYSTHTGGKKTSGEIEKAIN